MGDISVLEKTSKIASRPPLAEVLRKVDLAFEQAENRDHSAQTSHEQNLAMIYHEIELLQAKMANITHQVKEYTKYFEPLIESSIKCFKREREGREESEHER